MRARLSAKRLSVALTALALASVGVVGASTANAATQAHTPPVATQQAKVSPQKAATPEASKGKSVATNPDGSPKGVQAQPNVGNSSVLDFYTQYNYCSQAYTQLYVKNNTSSTQYYYVYFNESGVTRGPVYYSVAANSYSSPSFSGVYGNWSAYLYVWNGSSYAYDEVRSGANNCVTSRTLVTNSGYTGYVRLDLTNTGTAYAYFDNNELAPYPAYGTYTGEHWVYLAPGTSYSLYFYVNTGLSYGIYSSVFGSSYGTMYWSGHL